MQIINKNGDILITDENIPRTWPSGCHGTAVLDFYSYYHRGKSGIEHFGIEYGHWMNKRISVDDPNFKQNGYFVLHGYEHLVPEIKRDLRKKKLKKLNENGL